MPALGVQDFWLIARLAVFDLPVFAPVFLRLVGEVFVQCVFNRTMPERTAFRGLINKVGWPSFPWQSRSEKTGRPLPGY